MRNLRAVTGWRMVARVLYVVLASFGGLLLSTFIVYGSSAVKMTYEADRMIGSAESLANAALGCGGDVDLSHASHTMVDAAGKLRDELDSPKWTIVRDHTSYGNDITAARTMLGAVADLVDGPFADLMGLSTQFSGFSMDDKTVDLSALLEIPGILANAHAVIGNEVNQLGSLAEPTIPAVANLVTSGRTMLESVDGLLAQYDDLVNLIPQLLGANGKRTYLVAIYNPAELRSGGGMVGNIAAVTADAGKVEIGDFVVTSSFEYGTQPLDDENKVEGAVFGDQVYRYPQTTTVNPNFQRAAVTLKNLWAAQKGNEGVDVSGVFALDPVFMQSLIGATGNVTLSDGKVLDGTNAVPFFLSDLYTAHPDFQDQDQYTNESSKRIMSSVFSNVGASTASGVLRAIRSSSADGHFKVWMEQTNELEALVQTQVLSPNAAGMLPDDPLNPTAGIYLTEAVASKLDWYLQVETSVTKTCGSTFASAGTSLSDLVKAKPRSTMMSAISQKTLGDEYTVQFTLRNTMTEEQAQTLPTFVTGETNSGTMQPRLFLMAPAGGEITSIAYESGDFVANGIVSGHQFINLRLTDGVKPESEVTVAFTVRAREDATAPLNVVTTPVINANGIYTGTNGQADDQCGTDVPDAQQDQRYGSGALDPSDLATAAPGDSATPTPSFAPEDQNSADTSGSALDSLDAFRGSMSCPVNLKSLVKA
ncbi:DUF4012 domain-containing protein [Bifidobacterium avesanii]|nr:DUF4012 domain-containing protein [Bifidobacterium avesanii]